MKIEFKIPMLNLQLFAEGAGGAAGTGGDGGTAQGQGVTAVAAMPQTKGVTAPAAEVQNPTEAPPDLNAEFEQLIKGQYKEQYDTRVQDTIRKRLKGTQEIVDKYNSLIPTLELMAKKHGVDADDIAALNKAIQDDDSYFEEEALEKGMTVQQLKEFKKMERDNAELRKQIQAQKNQENANKLYASWMNQAEEAKKVYPSFNLKAEMENPKFQDLLRSNIDVKTAYEVVHKDEIIPAAMQFAAQTVESKYAKKIAANGARPAENGMSSGSPAVVKVDVSRLTKAERQAYIRRAQQGETIRF